MDNTDNYTVPTMNQTAPDGGDNSYVPPPQHGTENDHNGTENGTALGVDSYGNETQGEHGHGDVHVGEDVTEAPHDDEDTTGQYSDPTMPQGGQYDSATTPAPGDSSYPSGGTTNDGIITSTDMPSGSPPSGDMSGGETQQGQQDPGNAAPSCTTDSDCSQYNGATCQGGTCQVPEGGQAPGSFRI